MGNDGVGNIDLLGLALHPAARYGEIVGLLSSGLTPAQIVAALEGTGVTLAIVNEIAQELAKKKRCREIRAEIDKIQEGSLKACDCKDDDATLALKTAYYCGLALWRWYENTECFGGGDAGHKEKQEEAFVQCKKCRALNE